MATANKTTGGHFLYGNKKYRRQSCRMSQAYRALAPLQTPGNSANEEPARNPLFILSPHLTDYAAAFHCMGFARFLV